MKTIVFPEGNHPSIKQAVAGFDEFKPILLGGTSDDLAKAAQMVADGEADSMIAGINYTSRDVILTARDIIGALGKTFSSSFVMDFPDGRKLILADCATCKNPTAEQLADITLQTAQTAKKALSDEPKVAMLSFSTHGSGGHDDSMDKIREALKLVKAADPELVIDGELQLDAAINPAIAHKKAPDSPLKGAANVLIVPDINSGNILYKALEQLAGAHAYGPILQGFNKPLSDLSRGSTVEDIRGVIQTILRLL